MYEIWGDGRMEKWNIPNSNNRYCLIAKLQCISDEAPKALQKKQRYY